MVDFYPDSLITYARLSAVFQPSVLDGSGLITSSDIGASFVATEIFPGNTTLITSSKLASSSLTSVLNFVQLSDKSSWGITSKIGTFDFTKDDSGEVVEIPMSWSGSIYAIKKLGRSGVVFYGANGVTFCNPNGVYWGKTDLLDIGIKGKGAVCASEDDKEHFFIDRQGLFWRLKEGGLPAPTDYSNYFSSMSSNLVMNYDPIMDAIYICDGTNGYAWTDQGLGQCPPDLTGIGVRNNVLLSTGIFSETTDPFNVCTDTIDFGVRSEKTIYQIDFGVYSAQGLYAAVDYRWQTNQAFFTSPFVKADLSGRVFLIVSGVEFRIRIKLLAWEDIQLDYGNIHVRYDDLKPIGGNA